MELTSPIIQDQLVSDCQAGNVRRYEELYHKYAKAMYNTCLRIVLHPSDAEDILQEAFTDAFRSLEHFDFRSTFGAWLKKIVINKSINLMKKRKLAFIELDVVHLGHLPEEEPIDEKDLQFRVEDIKKAVSQLPDGYRTVLSLYLFEGYDQEEIAEILQISPSTVRTQYMRAKLKVLQHLKQGIAS